MERATSMALRQFKRIQTTKSCTYTTRFRFTTSSIHPHQTFSLPSQSAARTRTRSRISHSPSILQQYSTESPITGTIEAVAVGSSSPSPLEISLSVPSHLNDKEREIWELLMKELDCTELEVQDISGGCGSMYGIDIVSERFRGLNMLKQQRLVNGVLGEEIKQWHGVQLKTRAP
ncbi:bola protein [Calycina marina]|uniref:Bola protein n=1 Tax=Calycina marina TaxID=1763456 RepID=A0A9P8CDL0_9HELO|nr:bola protein [Calycina marina]